MDYDTISGWTMIISGILLGGFSIYKYYNSDEQEEPKLLENTCDGRDVKHCATCDGKGCHT